MKMTINYYVGWTGMPWRTDLLPEVAAPSNYKDPAKIAAVVQEKRAKQQETAGSAPIYGKLEAVTVLDGAGEVVFKHTSGDTLDGVADVTAGTAFATFLIDKFTFPTEDSDYELRVCDTQESARLIGIEVKTSLKMAAMEVIEADERGVVSGNFGELSLFGRVLPTRMWYRRTFCVDPFEMLRAGVPDLTLDSALSFLGGTSPAEYAEGADSQAHAHAWAARELATRTGIAQAVTMAQTEMHSL
jgi:hypothetical protein